MQVQEMVEMLNRIGIKGSPEQLIGRKNYLEASLRYQPPPQAFPVEVFLRPDDLENDQRLQEIIWKLSLSVQSEDKTISHLQLHTPYYYQDIPNNLLASVDTDYHQPTIDGLKLMIQLAQILSHNSGKHTTICMHAYHRPLRWPKMIPLTELGRAIEEIDGSIANLISNLNNNFSEQERQIIGIETMAYGPCTYEEDLIQIARETGCFIVCDVSHILRHTEITTDGEVIQGKYNNRTRLLTVIKAMLPYIKSWHICQHTGEFSHRDDQLAHYGIIRWEQIIPLMIQSFQENNAFAIIEVGDADMGQPFGMIGSNLCFRGLVSEHLS